MSTTPEIDEAARRVEDLRAFERQYRARLRAHLTKLLQDLNEPDRSEWPRQELIGPDWQVIVPGTEVRANGNGVDGWVCIEIRQVEQ